ncbi:PilN domain-containing protein [Bremerella sp. JC817]|uniref:PilN domain-containing protein n=1 Tax=Bremerella sp. JC817 TaxID=3231756 RepID=UPI003458F4BB
MAATSKKKNDKRPVFAFQIGHTKIRAVTYRVEGGNVLECEPLEENWQDGSLKLSSEEGKSGLKQAIRRLLSKLPRTIDEVTIALSGEFCVTRVVSDTNEIVAHEVREIESRSSLYLSLGHGPKLVAGSIVQQDPKHQHATVSVVHRQTIEAILEVTRSLNLKVKSVEPAVISLCRLLGALELDKQAPALLVCPGQSGVEIAISYQGHLYLDYRPAGIKTQEEIANILVHHLERLQRYCRRHARVLRASIGSVYLSGERFRVDAIRQQLGDRVELPIQILETAISGNDVSDLIRTVPVAYYAAAGAGLLTFREYATPGPNLTERLRSDHEENLWLRAARVFAPLAATIVLAIGVWGYLFTQRWELQQKQARASELEPVHREAILLQGVMARGLETLQMHNKLSAMLPRKPVASWVRDIGQHVPEDTWLTGITLGSDGDITVEGNAITEPSVFAYAEHLKRLSFTDRATVDGAIPSNTKAGPAIKFTIHCDIDVWEELESRNDDSI